MKKRKLNLALWLPLAVLILSQGQAPAQESIDGANAAVFHIVRFIDVETKNRDAFVKAVEEKTRKYNATAESSQWWTYQILNGPRANMYARGFGGVTAAQLDSPKFPSQGLGADWNPDEAQYWKKHVQPLEKSAGNGEIWREITGTRYHGLPKGSHTRFVRHRKWKMLPGMYQRLETHYQKLTEAIAASKRPINWGVGRLEMGGDFMTYAETISFNKLEDTLLADQLSHHYNKLHGEGSWKEFLLEHSRIMQPNAKVMTEVWEFKPTMSSTALDKSK